MYQCCHLVSESACSVTTCLRKTWNCQGICQGNARELTSGQVGVKEKYRQGKLIYCYLHVSSYTNV